LPIIGWIDDGVILTLLVTEVSQLLGERLKSADKNSAGSTVTDNGTATASTSEPLDVKAVSVD
jgi:uncharacterized membrane protein YkvA (DUF1232 family)